MPSSLEHLRTFSERPHMSMERFLVPKRQKSRECEWVERCESAERAKQRVVLIIRRLWRKAMP